MAHFKDPVMNLTAALSSVSAHLLLPHSIKP